MLFYCHFPDYLLASRKSLVKSLYRIPFDWVEGFTTGLAGAIVVNSNFTKSVFATAFPKIKQVPHVVYPCVDVSDKKTVIANDQPRFLADSGRKILLSINRFERKKNIGLAIRSFALLSNQERLCSRLVIAGKRCPFLVGAPNPYDLREQADMILVSLKISTTTTNWWPCATCPASSTSLAKTL